LNDALVLSWIEMRKALARSVLYTGIALAVMTGLTVAIRGKQFPGVFEAAHSITFYGNAAEIFMAVLMAKALGDEFYYKTSTFVFSSSSSRLKILASKWLYHFWIAAVFAVFAIGVSCAAQWILEGRVDTEAQWNLALKIVPVYLLFALAAGSFLLAVGSVTLNIVGPLIAYVVVFWFLPGAVANLLERWFSLEKIETFLSPLFLRTFLVSLDYDFRDAIALVLFSAFCFALAAFIMNLRDLH